MLQLVPFHRSVSVLYPLLLPVNPTAHAVVAEVASTSRSSPPPGGSGLAEMLHLVPFHRSITGRLMGMVLVSARPTAQALLGESASTPQSTLWNCVRLGLGIRDATAAYASQDDASYYAGNLRFLEPAYLRATTAEGGSGFGGDSARWRARRAMIVDGIDRNGTFLDLGCANGLLMESVVAWAAERGSRVEPYGLDFAPGLVELARRRLPHWAGRIHHGNAIDWIPPDGRRFTLVHTLLDLVPVARRADLVRHALGHLVEPSGRLLVSHYQSAKTSEPPVDQILRSLGFAVTASSSARDNPREATAWIDIHQNGS